MELIDTHCHIHAIESRDPDDYVAKKWHDAGIVDSLEVIAGARAAEVTRMICVGTELEDSRRAVSFAKRHKNVWASVGIHPHDGASFLHTAGAKEALVQLLNEKDEKLVAIGECGLDYYYEHSPKSDQIEMLEFQLDLANKHNLPVIFHIRDAFDDFWPIFDNFMGLKGVVHSFSSNTQVLEQILSRGLHVGLNGIMTFTKDQSQLDAAKNVPLERLLLETDAPYLTPKPFRGKVCKPEHTKLVALFLSELRGEPLEVVASTTTSNAQTLFGVQ